MLNWIVDLWVCAWRPLLALLIVILAAILFAPDSDENVIRMHGPQKPTIKVDTTKSMEPMR